MHRQFDDRHNAQSVDAQAASTHTATAGSGASAAQADDHMDTVYVTGKAKDGPGT